MTTLTDYQVDTLREVATIGLGNAINPIAKLISQKVNFTVPNVTLTSIETVGAIIGPPGEKVMAVVVGVGKDLSGIVMLVISPTGADQLAAKIANTKRTPVFEEVVNIISGSALTALAKLLGVGLDQTVPASATDMCRAVVNQVAASLGAEADNLLVMNTVLTMTEENITARLAIIFDPQSAEKILTILNDGPKSHD